MKWIECVSVDVIIRIAQSSIAMSDDPTDPITGVCIVADPYKCPPRYDLVRCQPIFIWYILFI